MSWPVRANPSRSGGLSRVADVAYVSLITRPWPRRHAPVTVSPGLPTLCGPHAARPGRVHVHPVGRGGNESAGSHVLPPSKHELVTPHNTGGCI